MKLSEKCPKKGNEKGLICFKRDEKVKN